MKRSRQVRALFIIAALWFAVPRVAAALPVVDKNFSGQVLLIVNEEDNNLVAVPIDTDGSIDGAKGVGLADSNNTFENDPDAVAATPDGRFAYVHEEGHAGFYRFDLQHIEVHGTGHIKKFTFSDQQWLHDGLVVLEGALYATAQHAADCNPCDTACPTALYMMVINPMTGDLGTPTFVTDINDGMGHVANGFGSRLATDGTCIYASDAGEEDFCAGSTDSSGTKLIYQICPMPVDVCAVPTVKVWADTTTGGDAPGLDQNRHTIVFGPNNQNLFLSENNHVYSTTGPSGSTPGSFVKIGDLPGFDHVNEGSAFTLVGGLQMLYVGDEQEESAYFARITGSGGSVALGATGETDGEDNPDGGLAGDLVDFDEAEGMAIIPGSPLTETGIPLFLTTLSPAPALTPVGLGICVVLLVVLGVRSLSSRRANT